MHVATRLDVGAIADFDDPTGTGLDEGIAMKMHPIANRDGSSLIGGKNDHPGSEINMPSEAQLRMADTRRWIHKSTRRQIRETGPLMEGPGV
jgi:hypothetical protein